MAFVDHAPRRDRLRAIAAVAILHVALGYALVAGLRVDLPTLTSRSLALFTVTPPPAPRPPPPPRAHIRAKAPHREGAAAPPALVARATEVVAPVPVVPPPPPPVIAAPRPDDGAMARQGAAPVPGPGSGAGGIGDGTGNGDDGDGPGGGGDGGTPLRLIKGHIDDTDYPRGALEAGIGGTVGLRFVVGTNGRVTDCRVTRSSGNAELDTVTCRLIRNRFRYRPTRDAQGRAVADVVTGEQEWTPYER